MNRKISILFLIVFFTVLCVHAQDYFIQFAGKGASTVVDSVRVENISQNTSLTVDGKNTLHLVGIRNKKISTNYKGDNDLRIYPNPIEDAGKIEFVTAEPGLVKIALFDVSGRQIIQS